MAVVVKARMVVGLVASVALVLTGLSWSAGVAADCHTTAFSCPPACPVQGQAASAVATSTNNCVQADAFRTAALGGRIFTAELRGSHTWTGPLGTFHNLSFDYPQSAAIEFTVVDWDLVAETNATALVNITVQERAPGSATWTTPRWFESVHTTTFAGGSSPTFKFEVSPLLDEVRFILTVREKDDKARTPGSWGPPQAVEMGFDVHVAPATTNLPAGITPFLLVILAAVPAVLRRRG